MLRNGKISACDTETIGGYAVILSTEHRTWEAHSFEECVKPIFMDIHNRKIGSRIMMWNQGYDSQAILKYLPDENVNEILESNQTIYNDRYKITYIRGKMLRIRDMKLKETMSGYDLAQFFNYAHLNDAGEEFVGEGKYHSDITHEITERAKYHTDNELYWIFAHNRDEIMHYCMQDAKLTQKLGYYLSDIIYEMYRFKLSSYAAKTIIGKELIKNTVGLCECGNGKKIKAYPKFNGDSQAGKMATLAYHGGIFDCMKRGSFSEVTDIDISSAYPAFMKDLPNWSNGDFIEVTDNEIKDNDKYGWVICCFNYPLIPYTSNLINRWQEIHNGKEETVIALNPRKFYPDGERWQVITLVEYRFLKKYGYLIEGAGGYVWRHNPSKPQYPNPFTWINEVYKKKQNIKATLGKKVYQYSLTKIPMNSAYGTTAQKKGYAEYRNDFYASYITASTRIQICEMLEEIGYDSYITIATDGILIKGHIEIPKQYTQGGLGSWDVEYWDKALVLANGIYQLEREHKNPDKRVKMALRGMLTYDGDLKNTIEKHRDKKEFVPNTKDRPVTMYQAMRWKKYTRDSMNRFIPIGRKLTCNTDTTKHWNVIKTFSDILNNTYTGRRFTIDEVEKL